MFGRITRRRLFQNRWYSKERLEEIAQIYHPVECDHYESSNWLLKTIKRSFIFWVKVFPILEKSRELFTQNPIPNIENIAKFHTSGQMHRMDMVAELQIWFQTSGLPFYNLSQTVSVLYTEVLPRSMMLSITYSKRIRFVKHLAGKSNYSFDIVFEIDFKDFITTDTANQAQKRRN